MFYVANVNLTTLSGDIVYSWNPQVNPDWPKETRFSTARGQITVLK
jgi:hypothetical protein